MQHSELVEGFVVSSIERVAAIGQARMIRRRKLRCHHACRYALYHLLHDHYRIFVCIV
jgi:hypothetical protein